MGMTLVFVLFAAVAYLVSVCFPYLAGGLGLDMTGAYLVLALLSAIIALLRTRSAG